MGTKQNKPTKEEIAAQNEDRYAENLEILQKAHALAKEGWKTTKPTMEQVMGVLDSLEDGALTEEMIVPLYGAARDQAAKIGLSETEDVLTVLDVMLADEDHGKHFEAATKTAKELFGGDCAGNIILAVYFQIYGVDEDSIDDEE